MMAKRHVAPVLRRMQVQSTDHNRCRIGPTQVGSFRQIMASRKRRSRRHQLSWTAQRVCAIRSIAFDLFFVLNIFQQRCDAVRRSGLAERKRKARGFAKVCVLCVCLTDNAAVCMPFSSCLFLIVYHRIKARPESSFERFQSFAASASFAPGALRPALQFCATTAKRFRWRKGTGATICAQRCFNSSVFFVVFAQK